MSLRTLAGVFIIGVIVLVLGCSSDVRELGPTVWIQKQTLPDGCYVPCHGPAPLDSSVFSDLCPNTGSQIDACTFEGGVDKVRVIASYGDVLFRDFSEVPEPVLAWVFDQQALPDTRPLHVQPKEERQPDLAAGVFTVPARRASDVRMRVGVGSSYVTEIADLKINALAPSMSVAECPDTQPCGQPAGVGQIAVTIVTARDALDTTAILTTQLNGVPDAAVQTIELAPSSEGRRLFTAYLRVPDETGALWTLQARLGDRLVASRNIQLMPPALSLVIQNCSIEPVPCELKAGTSVVVRLAGPQPLQARQGVLLSYVNGVQSLTTVPVLLDQVEGSVRTGTLGLQVPGSQKDTWQLRAIVGNAPPILARPVTVVAP